MRTLLVDLLGQRVVDILNLCGQAIALLVGAVLFYQTKAFERLKKGLAGLARLKRHVLFAVGPNVYGFGIGTRRYRHEASIRAHLVGTGLVLGAFLLANRSIAHWAVYPIQQLMVAVTVWRAAAWGWGLLLLPLESLGFLLWALVSMSVLWGAGVAIPVRTVLLTVEGLEGRLTASRFNFLLFLLFLASGLVIIVTGTDLTGP